jgi:acyl dehydratase
MSGLYFEEFLIGDVIQHDMRRTVTEADNIWFSTATCNPAAIHLDEQYCVEHSEFGTRIVNSAFTLGLMVGLSVGDTTLGTTVGNLGMDEVRFPNPVFHGDTCSTSAKASRVRLRGS